MKHIIVSDTHVGCRDDNPHIAKHQRDVWAYILDYAEANDIRHFYHLGDFFDNRKKISLKTMEEVEHLTCALDERGITVDLLVGNHDTAYKNTNRVNSPEFLLDPTIFRVFIEDVTEENDIIFVNWLNSENFEDAVKKIESSKAKYCFGHFDINGFKFQKDGKTSESVLNQSSFFRFQKVLSGHFHTRQAVGNIEYIGSPFEMTWADHDDPKGFTVFDDEAGTFDFVPHGIHLFQLMYIGESVKSPDNFNTPRLQTMDELAGRIVRVVTKLSDKDNEKLIANLSKFNPAQLQLVPTVVTVNLSNVQVDVGLNPDKIASDYIMTAIEDKSVASNVLEYVQNLLKDAQNAV